MACYASEFLQAEFRVTVKDSIFGALALQAFAEMVRKAFGKHYRTGQIDFEMSQAAGSLHNHRNRKASRHPVEWLMLLLRLV